MIRLRTDFFAESLGMSTSMVVLLPQHADGQIGMEDTAPETVPVLYLLHGLSDDCTIWERRTSIERYAAERGVAVVMPEVRRSFYADEVQGEKYWTFVSEELPQLIARTFRVSTEPADTFVAGLSMGGFGAMKLALHHPERYAAAASLSGALDLPELDIPDASGVLAQRVWGGRALREGPEDLLHLLRRAEPGSLPDLFVSCGTEDFLIEENRRFLSVAEESGHAVTQRLVPGEHSWALWDAEIQQVLAWLPLRNQNRG